MKIPEQWTFEESELAAGFDAHVREQLPWYELATRIVAHIARHYIPERGGLVYDIGASTGNICRAIVSIADHRGVRLVAIDKSAPMLDKLSMMPIAEALLKDALEVDYEPFDLAICFLVLQFMPVADRAGLIARLIDRCRPGGALVIVDKLEPAAGYPGAIMLRLALAAKLEAGAKPEDVIAKELSLSGVQRPLAVSEVKGGVEFFRVGDFAGYLIEKPRP